MYFMNKMDKCDNYNTKFTYYLEFCKYNLDNLKNIIFTLPQQAILEKNMLGCEEFKRAIREEYYNDLKYILVIECSK